MLFHWIAIPDRPFLQRTLSLIFLITCLVGGGTAAYADSSETVGVQLGGTVVDKATGLPLSGASVDVIGTSLSTITDQTGNFAFTHLPTGQYSIRVLLTGYQPTETENAIFL